MNNLKIGRDSRIGVDSTRPFVYYVGSLFPLRLGATWEPQANKIIHVEPVFRHETKRISVSKSQVMLQNILLPDSEPFLHADATFSAPENHKLVA
ncbi:hypothetical protein CMK17_17210 [Candidatus Poribacteria bacterium]|jgi:hypothetical protein|nr:hypothetical protein [Candidatus Poribacteria bacterium]|tara:strand:+ start:601 stop:885 length:285 start_codon:yes stop_codon:yes gene_type:complete